MSGTIRTVLVANRGEIAMRVLRTVKAMGLRGAVVYHAADRDAPAAAAADIAISIIYFRCWVRSTACIVLFTGQ